MEHIVDVLQYVEKHLLQSLDHPKKLKALHDLLQSAPRLAERQAEEGGFDNVNLRALSEQVARIKHIATLFRNIEIDREQLIQEARKDVKGLADEEVRKACACGSGYREDHVIDKNTASSMNHGDTLTSKLLRQWFLDNLADPFPSKRTKGELVDKTNALIEAESPATAKVPLAMKPIDIQQCSLWFVNSRRRSGWTDFHRRFGQSEKSIMAGVIDSLKAEEGAEQPGRNSHLESILQMNPDGFKCSRVELASRVEQCREAYASMLDWLHQRKKEEVGDWMAEVIEEARQEVKQAKAEARLERKRAADDREEGTDDRRQKRKAEEAPSSSESAAGEPRYPYRNLRRRTVHMRSKGQPAKPSTTNSTPDNFFDQSFSSKVPTTLGNSDGSRRVPSLTHSEGSTSRSSSSSSTSSIVSSASSLSVYPGTLEAQGSPTLRILRNSQPKNADHTMMTLPQGYGLQRPPLDCSVSKPTDEAYSLTPISLILPDWLQVPTSEPNL